MKIAFRYACSTFLLVLSVAGSTVAQEQVASISRLKEQILALESIERDPNTAYELRSINRQFLSERRANLAMLLRKRIDVLRDYQLTLTSTLTEGEKEVVRNSIRTLEAELRNVDGNMSGTRAATESASDTSPGKANPVERPLAGAVPSRNGSSAAVAPAPAPAAASSDDGETEADVVTIVVSQDLADNLANTIKFDQKDPITDPTSLIDGTIKGLVHDDYCIVHGALWGKAGEKVDIKKESWSLYKLSIADGARTWKKQKDFDGKRIYGSHRVAVLLVHLKALKESDITYKVAKNKKTPAPFKHAIDLVGALAPAGGGGGDADIHNVWGGQLIDVEDVPSDIIVSASIAVNGEQNKEFSKTYDNEGRYHWDVSVGMPLKGVKELQFNSENGRVTASVKERQNAYGFLNIYPVAVDVKGEDYLTFPHLLFGVPLAGKPLDRPMIGIGTGVYKTAIKFNIFAGVVFNRVREPKTFQTGDAATPSQLESDIQTRRVRKFIFGINFPVGQIKDALSKSK